MQILRAEDRVWTPWKNGGGLTAEIAAFPPNAGFDSFDWRISTARIAADGPFSIFPGVDRTLAVLEGGGLRLRPKPTLCTDVHQASSAVSFAGDVQCSAEVIDGPVLDLNVMVRRGVVEATVRHLTEVSSVDERFTSDWTVLLPLGPARLSSASGVFRLKPLDAVVIENGETACVQVDDGRGLYRITLNAAFQNR